MSKYIAIEGLDGAGKSTAAKAIVDFFKNEDIVNVREPGGTILAEKMRGLVKDEYEGEEVHVDTEAYLFYGARNQLLTQVVIPSLESGKLVLSDRCNLSSEAYQGESELVPFLSKRIAVKPELIIYLDISPKIGLERVRSREELDRIEKKGLGFYDEVRARYVAFAEEREEIEFVDAHGTIEEVYNAVFAVLQKRYA